MYTIVNKNSGQWVSESCAGIVERKTGDVHFTNRIDLAATFPERHQAYRAMKKIEKRFSGHSLKTSKLSI